MRSSPQPPALLTHEPADRVVVIGLDCASPMLLFALWPDELPHLSALMRRGFHGTLRSCHPPITVPAWRVMASGRDAGWHGVYGFRNQEVAGGYGMGLTHSGMFRGAVWEELAAEGLRSTLVGLPGTWPPPEIQGCCVSGPLTPSLEADFAWPPELAAMVRQEFAGYEFDVADHRNLSEGELIARVRTMTSRRFDLTRRLASRDDWNLLWVVEIGLDRLHHALWHHVDPSHPRFIPASVFKDALLAYHQQLDAYIGQLVGELDDGETAFLVVSDHGARPMVGGFCVNTWLMERGWLHLRRPADVPTRLSPDLIDWSRTVAWGAGGYYARIFLNVEGREPEGIVPAGEVDALLSEIKAALEAEVDPDGQPMGNAAWRPEQLFEVVHGAPPDLLVYLGDLAWRSLDTVGAGLFTEVNDTGADAANHDWEGVIVGAGAGVAAAGAVEGLSILDVAPLLRGLLLG